MRKTPVWCSNDEVVVVTHQAIRDALECIACDDRVEMAQKGMAVIVPHKQGLPVATTRSHVVDPAVDEELNTSADHQALIEDNLHRALELAADCQTAYRDAPPAIKKLFNQTFFKKVYIDDESCLRAELAPPFDVLLSDQLRTNVQAHARGKSNGQSSEVRRNDNTPEMASIFEGVERVRGTRKVPGLKEQVLVGAPGIEPGTSRV